MCWWLWSSSPLTLLKAFTWIERRRMWELVTRFGFIHCYLIHSWVAGVRHAATVRAHDVILFCCTVHRVWCSDMPLMKLRSVCPSPLSWLTSSMARWLRYGEMEHCRGSGLIPKHRWDEPMCAYKIIHSLCSSYKTWFEGVDNLLLLKINWSFFHGAQFNEGKTESVFWWAEISQIQGFYIYLIFWDIITQPEGRWQHVCTAGWTWAKQHLCIQCNTAGL